MQTDIFGNTLSLTNAATRDEWDKMQLGFLAHAAITPTHLAAVLEAEPNFAMGHASNGSGLNCHWLDFEHFILKRTASFVLTDH